MSRTRIKTSDIADNTIAAVDISPTAAITSDKISGGNIAQIDTNNFNIGVLGFKMAVNEGLTVFNLVDGVVDEFNDETGIDTAENNNATYDNSSDFYKNENIGTSPPTQDIFSFTSTGPSTYTVEPGVTSVNVLIVGGGGGGGAGGYNDTQGGGGGAGGLIYYPNYPVTPGGTVAITVGTGGKGGGPAPYEAAVPLNPSTGGTGEVGGYTNPSLPAPVRSLYSPGEKGSDSSFGPLIGEGGGAGGGYLSQSIHPSYGTNLVGAYGEGGSGGGAGSSGSPYFRTTVQHSPFNDHTQLTNHPIPLTPSVLPINSPGAFGNHGGLVQPANTDNNRGEGASGGGGGAGAEGGDTSPPGDQGGAGGIGLSYNIADGSTSVGYAGGGDGVGTNGTPKPSPSEPFGGGAVNLTPYGNANWFPGLPGQLNTGGGGGGGDSTTPSPVPAGGAVGGDGGPGIVIVKELQGAVASTSLTLISDTFTANSTPTTARIVLFAELTDDLNTDITTSVTRDNTTFDAVTLTDTGYVSGSSGTKIYTGSTPLTGTASPQVQLRWKIVGSSLTDTNKIHGVSLQWA
tara:strand:- start:418 stop:2124 length:1707 start_codon:yes stop_codon:yes gene_type:complete